MTWKELKDKISLMTEEEQQKEVAVWGENMNLMKDCSLEKTDEDLYYNTEWDYTCEESELEPEDKNDPDVHKVYEAGMHYIYSNRFKKDLIMAALTTLNITEKNANNSLSVTVKVNVTKEGVFTTTLSKEDVDKIHSYGIKLPTNRLGNEGYFNSIALSDLESQIREVLKRCLSCKIVEEVSIIKYQLETTCMFSYDKNGDIAPNTSKEWTGGDENGEWRYGTSRLHALNARPFGFSVYAKPFLKKSN